MSTAQCRDLKKLNGLVRVQLKLALADLREQGVNPLVVETLRTKERQYMLYGQGRTKEECKAKGVPVKYAAPDKSKVTWILNSIHISGFAVDVVPQRIVNGKMTAIWNVKDKDTQRIIATMIKYGFEAGANWTSNPDSPHFQVKGVSGGAYSQNNTNTQVTTAVQMALNEAIDADLVVDGDWGAKTTAAVKEFQKRNGWKQSGVLGKKALKKLLKHLK